MVNTFNGLGTVHPRRPAGAVSRDHAIFSGESFSFKSGRLSYRLSLKDVPARRLVETEPKLTIHAHL